MSEYWLPTGVVPDDVTLVLAKLPELVPEPLPSPSLPFESGSSVWARGPGASIPESGLESFPYRKVP